MITVLENFYSNLQDILSMAEKSKGGYGCGAGLRSQPLQYIYPEFYNIFFDRICDISGISKSSVHLDTNFTYHTHDNGNIRRVHIDGRNPNTCTLTPNNYNLVLGGQIFLGPVSDMNSGIKFYDTKSSCSWTPEEEFYLTLDGCYNMNSEELIEYHKNFDENLIVKNKQNRLVYWTAGTKHKSENLSEVQNTRWTQNFFLTKK